MSGWMDEMRVPLYGTLNGCYSVRSSYLYKYVKVSKLEQFGLGIK